MNTTNHHPKTRDSRSGSALLTVVSMILIFSIVLGSLYSISSQRTFSLARESNRLKALSIAEAGMGHAFSHIAEDVSRAANGEVVSNSNFSGGEYVVRASVPDGVADGVVLLTATGRFNGHERVSVASIQVQQENLPEPGITPVAPLGPFGPVALLAGVKLEFSGGVTVNLLEFGAHANGNTGFNGGPALWAGALSTNGSLILTGNSQIQLDGGNGFMHADGAVSLKGTVDAAYIYSSTSIDGHWGGFTSATLVAPDVSYKESNPPDIVIQDVPEQPQMSLPPLDVEAFETYAKGYDWYYQGKQNVNRSWLTKDIEARTGENVNNNETLVVPEGGVMFVEGDVTLNSDMDFEGVLIATGDIRVNGAATFANPTDFPAIVSVDGDIQVGGGASGLTVGGWIYAMNGSVKATGGASGMGGIIAAQDIVIRGGYSLGSADDIKAVTWPGADTGGGNGDDSASGGVRLLSWIR